MSAQQIPIISVSYNSAELIDGLLGSLRVHYSNPVTIIDGSSEAHYRGIEAVCQKYPDVRFIHFDYNIHHGPGMAWAFENLELAGPVLVLDSDVEVLKAGMIESMLAELKPGMYGVGYVNHVNEGGFDVNYEDGAIRYLHPACMLCNIEVVRQWPMPTKHGAPMTVPMLALHRAGKQALIQGIDWVKHDFSEQKNKNYLRHDWQGTVKRTGGYHLEEWASASNEVALVRRLAYSLMPATAARFLELGANDHALARVVKEARPDCHYVAVNSSRGQVAPVQGACDAALTMDIDALDDGFFRDWAKTDCWVMDQLLERIHDPRRLLTQLRKVIQPDGCIVAIIPNAQHWSMLAQFCVGDLRYGSSALWHEHQLRWFSRATIFELFAQAGYKIVQGYPVTHQRLEAPALMAAIKQLAVSVGANPDVTFEDVQPVQYIVKAIPA